MSDVELYEALAIEDIQRAADILRPVYERTAGLDGYVSLEVSPELAHDTAATVDEARRLFAALGRPNILIKVPATPAGIPAIETLIGAGININVTLIFSQAHVASVFVSRADTAVDRALEALGSEEALSLRGKIAIANAKVIYARFHEIFGGERWSALAAQGARVQRPLWASTSTKNPDYPDTMYVDALIGPHTVNTVPPATLQAFLDHGTVALTVEEGLAEARAQLDRLAGLGIDLEAVMQQLQDDGVAAFAQSFESLLTSVGEKYARLQAEQHHATGGRAGS